MRVALTGATGFVGRYLADRLLAENHFVTCFVRTNNAYSKLQKHPNLEILVADLNDGPLLKKNLQTSDVVYHLAGSVFSSDKKELFRINRDYTRNIYTALKRSSVKRFIYLSSIAAVGPANETLNENVSPQPLSNYGKSKLSAEIELKRCLSEVQIPVAILRCPLIYGQGMSEESRIHVLAKAILDKKFKFVGSGSNHISFCHVDTLVDFLVQITTLQLAEFEIFHIADEKIFTLKELVGFISEVLSVAMPTKRISLPVAFSIATMLDSIRHIYPVKNSLTVERLKEIVGNWEMDISKAKKYGFKPRLETQRLLSQIIKGDSSKDLILK